MSHSRMHRIFRTKCDFNEKNVMHKNSFACLFSVHSTISLSRHEQVCLMRLRFERYFSHHQPDAKRLLLKS